MILINFHVRGAVIVLNLYSCLVAKAVVVDSLGYPSMAANVDHVVSSGETVSEARTTRARARASSTASR